MARSEISFFVDDNSVSNLQGRFPSTLDNTPVYSSGVFGGASNSPGIGISTENPELDDSLPNWTLLDQHGNARESQIGQLVGGHGICGRTGNVGTTWDKTQPLYTENGAASSGGITTGSTTGVGTAPDATIRLMPEDQLPTAADKEADSNVDGELTLPAQGANLSDLATGWEPAP